jgi:hypothetical protein
MQKRTELVLRSITFEAASLIHKRVKFEARSAMFPSFELAKYNTLKVQLLIFRPFTSQSTIDGDAYSKIDSIAHSLVICTLYTSAGSLIRTYIHRNIILNEIVCASDHVAMEVLANVLVQHIYI